MKTKPHYGIPKNRHENYGIHLKKMGKHQYYCVRYREGRKWKARSLTAENLEDARILRDVFYNYLLCYGLPPRGTTPPTVNTLVNHNADSDVNQPEVNPTPTDSWEP